MKTTISLFTITAVLTLATKLYAGPNIPTRLWWDKDVDGGIVVQLGCDATTSGVARHLNGRFVVQSLDRDPENVAAARTAIAAEGLQGVVSARVLQGRSLPFADNLVNVVVVNDSLGIEQSEILRVLRPLGVAWSKKGDTWERIKKPWPDTMDEWTHFLHDASGNAVSQDKEVGPPRRLQWRAGPRWGRSHEFNSSMPAMVTARGRVFYVFDYGPTGVEDQRLPQKWTLVARDAFNGTLLWERPMPTWDSKTWGSTALRFFGGAMARRLVAHHDHLFCTLEFGKEVQELDAGSGKILAPFPGTAGAAEILVNGDHLITVGNGNTTITCSDLNTRKRLWQTDDRAIQPQLTTAARDAVVYKTRDKVVCLNRNDGSVRWRLDPEAKKNAGKKPKKPSRNNMLLVTDDQVIVVSGSKMSALALDTGDPLWTAPGPQGSTMRGYDLFAVNGKAWCSGPSGSIVGYDLKTGAQVEQRDVSSVQSHGHHLRCHRAKATTSHLITQWRGVEFLSLGDEPHNQNDWMRGACTYGIMPANGFLYQPPHSCFCYAGSMMQGLNALRTRSDDEIAGAAKHYAPGNLEKGPAFGKVNAAPADPRAWPSYRGGPRRTGSISGAIQPKLKRGWKTGLGTRLTPPVAADGRVFVAARERHTVHALDAGSGKQHWSFTAGARIDSPPSIHKGHVVFGCADGFLYCLDAKDGQLAWRRRLAPKEEWIAIDGQLESVWRLHGSVAVVGDLAYCSAGRSTYLDGGLFLYAVDIPTGRIKHQTRVHKLANTRVDNADNEFVPSYHIEGGNSDLLVAEGGAIFLNQMKFSPELEPLPAKYLTKEEITARKSLRLDNKDYVNEDIYKVRWRNTTYDTYDKLSTIIVDENQNVGARDTGRHMLTTSGFLDDSYFSRTFWMYSDTWPGFNMTILAPKSGQLVVVGPHKTYALKAYTSRFPLSPKLNPQTKGYLLVADDNDNEPTMDPRAWGKDKGMGFGRGAPPVWHHWIPVRGLAMALAGETLFVCGPADVVKEGDPMASFEGRLGSELWAISTRDGSVLAKHHLDELPAFDGLIAAGNCLYLTTASGEVIAMQPE